MNLQVLFLLLSVALWSNQAQAFHTANKWTAGKTRDAVEESLLNRIRVAHERMAHQLTGRNDDASQLRRRRRLQELQDHVEENGILESRNLPSLEGVLSEVLKQENQGGALLSAKQGSKAPKNPWTLDAPNHGVVRGRKANVHQYLPHSRLLRTDTIAKDLAKDSSRRSFGTALQDIKDSEAEEAKKEEQEEAQLGKEDIVQEQEEKEKEEEQKEEKEKEEEQKEEKEEKKASIKNLVKRLKTGRKQKQVGKKEGKKQQEEKQGFFQDTTALAITITAAVIAGLAVIVIPVLAIAYITAQRRRRKISAGKDTEPYTTLQEEGDTVSVSSEESTLPKATDYQRYTTLR